MVRLLLVEDDARIAAAVAAALGRADYDVSLVASGAEALAADAVDLVLLDLGLPDMDGIEVCRQIRDRSSVPIIVLTARGTSPERILGLTAGADDYLVKPFSLAELKARIEAVLRRTGLNEEHNDPLIIGDVTIDPQSHGVTVDGVAVGLSRKEYDLLHLLATNLSVAMTRAELLQAVWHTDWEGRSRTVDVHVGMIRQKTGRPELIRTIHGVGYIVDPA